MKKIVVTTDLSTASKSGIRFAIQLQSQVNCELIFYYLVELTKPTSWSDKRFTVFSKEKIEEHTAKLERFVTAIYTSAGRVASKCVFKVELGLNAGDKIITFAKKTKADYICLSTHGASNLNKIMGTHASMLVTNSKTPVFVVPKNYKIKPITRVFYASDLSSLSTEIKRLEMFTAPLKLKLNVVHYDYLLHVPENKKKLESKTKKYLSANTSFDLKKQDIELSLSAHLRKDIAKQKPSVVVLFTRQNRSWFDKLFSNSESEEMVFNAQVPLLVFRKK